MTRPRKAVPETRGSLEMSAAYIEKEMKARRVKFDLSGDFYISYVCTIPDCITKGAPRFADDDKAPDPCLGCRQIAFWKTYGRKWVFSHVDQFWTKLETTNDVRVPTQFKDWIVGQEMAIKKTRLELMRWVEKEKMIQSMKKRGIDPSGMLKERPGPYVLFVSEPGCLYKNTRIIMDDGSIRLLSSLGTYHLEPIDVGLQTVDGVDRAKVFHAYKEQPVLRILMKSGQELIGTHNHPLMTTNGWKRFDEIRAGDCLKVADKIRCSINEYQNTAWKPRIDTHRTGTGAYLEYDTFHLPEKITPGLGYLFGYWLGDGSIRTSGNATRRNDVSFYVADNEKELVKPLVSILQTEFCISPKVIVRLQKTGNRTVPIHHIRVGSKFFADLFPEAHHEIPEFILCSPNDVVAAYLRGLFDADGHISWVGGEHKGCIIGLKQKNIQVLRDAQLLLLRFGVHSRIYIDGATQCGLLRISDNWSIKEFQQQIGFSVEHKKVRLSEYVWSMKRLVKYDWSTDEVVSVESAGKMDVFDVEVPETHMFLAAGVVSHNTGKCIASSTPVLQGNFDIGYPVWMWESSLISGKKSETMDDGEIIKNPDISIWQQTDAGMKSGKVKALYRQEYNGPMFKIQTSSGRYIQCSPEHGILTTKGWLPAKQIAVGLKVVVPAPLGETEGSIPTNPELAEFLAYILSEGHVVEGHPVSITNFDPAIRARIEYLLDKYAWTWNPTADGRAYLISHDVIKHVENYFQMGTKWSLYGKSAVKQLPPRIMMADLRAVKAFIGAYIAGDGSKAKRDNRITIATISQSMADHFVYLLLRLGIFASVRRKTQTLSYGDGRRYTSYELGIHSADNQKLMKLPFTAGKVEKLLDLSQRHKPWIEDKITDVKVFEYKGKYIYDFQMEDEQEPHYIAGHNGGIAVHNSLLIKIIAEEMEALYKEHNIELTDVLVIENKMDAQRPMVREVPAGVGQRIVAQAERAGLNEQKEKQQLLMTFLLVVMTIGGGLVATALFMMGVQTMLHGFAETWFIYSGTFLAWLLPGMFLLVFPMMLLMFRGSAIFGVDQKGLLNVPNLIVDNGPGRKLVINSNISNAPNLTGDIQWNAYGNTPGLSSPLHTRIVAGDVHKGNDKMIYIDEIRNLPVHLAIELLTVMEDGEAPIRAHSGNNAGNTESSAILAIATHDPVPANFFLVCAGNMDILYNPASIINQVSAFRDRFNYGDIIYFDTHMDATIENEIKIVQVVTDEIFRFGLKPMDRAALRRIVEYMRSCAENNTRFKVMWRYTIKVIIKSYELALSKAMASHHDTANTVITLEDVEEAIDVYCQSIEQQALREHLGHRRLFNLVPPTNKPEYGVVKGLAVVGNSAAGRSAGVSFPVAAQIFMTDHPSKADFKVTGTTKDAESWIQDSRQHVRAAILKMYGLDIEKETKTFISFSQQKGVEGPSAGVAMTLALMSLLGDPRLPKESRKPVPIRQDVAVTGTIELLPDPHNPYNVRVGAIGGVPDKVRGAADAGCRFVVVPLENYNYTLTQEKYPCVIFGADSILGYFDLMRGDMNVMEALQDTKKLATKEDIRLWTEKQVKAKKEKLERTATVIQ